MQSPPTLEQHTQNIYSKQTLKQTGETPAPYTPHAA